MAIYKEDIADINLETGNIHRSFLRHSIGTQDQHADHFGIRVMRDGEPVDLTGISVQGVFMPPQGGSPIAITGDTYTIVEGNVAKVILPQACYNYEGSFTLAIKLIDITDSITGTIRIIDGVVDNTHASGTVAPTGSVPTYQEILAVYDDMVDALVDVASYAANFAPTFAAGTANAAGSYVMYEGDLYLLPNGHEANVTWANTTKTQVNIGSQVSDLKSAFTDVTSLAENGEFAFAQSMFEQGSVSAAGAKTSSTTTIRNKVWLNVRKGTEIVFGAGTNILRMGIRIRKPDGTIYAYNGWITASSYVYIVNYDGELAIILQKEGTTNIAPSDYDATITVHTSIFTELINLNPIYMHNLYDVYKEQIKTKMRTESGNYGSDLSSNTSAEALPLMRIESGDAVCVNGDVSFNSNYYINFYDKDGTLVQNGSVVKIFYNSLVIAPAGSKYCRFSKEIAKAETAWIIPKKALDDARKNPGFARLDVFGICNGYGLKENEYAVSDVLSTSNYIPVSAGGVLLNMTDMNSSYYGIAFYDSTMTKVSFVAMGETLYYVKIPDTAAYVRFTVRTASENGKSIYYLPPGYKPECLNASEFGAIGDSHTDNTTILQRLFNVGGAADIPVYIPNGKYLITNTLTLRHQNASVYGDRWKRYSGTRIIMQTYKQTYSDGIISYPTDENGYQEEAVSPVTVGIRVINYGVSIRNIIFIPNFKEVSVTQYEDKQNLIATGIEIKINTRDSDAEVTGCTFRGCNVGIVATGRNVNINDNLFVHCNIGIDVQWSQRFQTEQRDIMIVSNRFHSCGRNMYQAP